MILSHVYRNRKSTAPGGKDDLVMTTNEAYGEVKLKPVTGACAVYEDPDRIVRSVQACKVTI